MFDDKSLHGDKEWQRDDGECIAKISQNKNEFEPASKNEKHDLKHGNFKKIIIPWGNSRIVVKQAGA